MAQPLPHVGTVERRALLDLLRDRAEEADEDPGRERDCARNVGHEQRAVGVDEPEVRHQVVERDDEADPRDDARHQVEEKEEVAEPEEVPREAVGGEDRQGERDERRHHRHDDGVHQPSAEPRHGEDGAVGIEPERFRQQAAALVDLKRRLERRQQRPEDRRCRPEDEKGE